MNERAKRLSRRNFLAASAGSALLLPQVTALCALNSSGPYQATGTRVGEVSRVDGGAGGSLLAVSGTRGEVLIPLARHICVEIDVAARRIRVDPPDGLLELNERRGRDADE